MSFSITKRLMGTVGSGVYRSSLSRLKDSGMTIGASEERSSTNYADTKFNVSGLGDLRNIYCRCGRITCLDSNQVGLKLRLGKELECAECRNARIARDIDELNTMYDPEYADPMAL